MALVLVVDDDPHIREVVCFALQRAGFATVEAGDGLAALRLFAERAPDLLVLDIVMPELDGTDVCRKLRARSTVPIVFVSSKDDEVDKIVGLELGGDDYITKPFSPAELVARVKALLRRASSTQVSAGPDKKLIYGALVLDLEAWTVTAAGARVVLTVTEFALLRSLMAAPNKVFSRDELMSRAYDEATVVSERTIDSHMRRVRQKLLLAGCDVVETIHGVGYKLREAQR